MAVLRIWEGFENRKGNIPEGQDYLFESHLRGVLKRAAVKRGCWRSSILANLHTAVANI